MRSIRVFLCVKNTLFLSSHHLWFNTGIIRDLCVFYVDSLKGGGMHLRADQMFRTNAEAKGEGFLLIWDQ